MVPHPAAIKDPPALVELLGVRRSILCCAAVCALPATARASPRAVTTEDLVAVRRADVLPHGAVSSRLVTEYGERLDRRARTAQGGAIFTRGVFSEATFAVGLFDHLQLEAGLPLVLMQRGTTLRDDDPAAGTEPLDGAGLGDVSFGAAGTFLALPARGVGLGAAFDVVAPTATLRTATYERGFRYVPQLTFSARGGRFEFHAAAGYIVRPKQRIGEIVVDDAVTYGLGTRVPLGRRKAVAFLSEASGEIAVDRRGADPLTLRIAVEVRTRRGPTFLLGAFGSPLLAPGAASVGATFGIGYAPPHRVGRSRTFEEVPRLSTASLIARHRAFVPAETAGSENDRRLADASDPDGDGIVAEADACPTVAEDPDGFMDGDGCPDRDDDLDGLADGADACPRAPEVVNGFSDDDGCPDVVVGGEGRTLASLDPDAVLPRLVFDAERSDANDALRSAVRDLAEILRLNPWIDRVELEIRVQDAGDPARAAHLAELRARLLTHLLTREGIPPDRFGFLPARTVPRGHPVRVGMRIRATSPEPPPAPSSRIATGYGAPTAGAAPSPR